MVMRQLELQLLERDQIIDCRAYLVLIGTAINESDKKYLLDYSCEKLRLRYNWSRNQSIANMNYEVLR